MHPLLRSVPRLQSLAVFESAARLGSFTLAARELGMTQPAVSRRVQDLEQSTGAALFHRSANRVALSEAGALLLTAVQSGFDTIQEGTEALDNRDQTFLLAANPGFAQQWIVPYLDQLQSVLGSTELRLRLFDRDGELDDERYDAAIHLTGTERSTQLSRRLFTEIAVPVASPEFAAEANLNGETRPVELLTATKLHLDTRDRTWLNWRKWFAANELDWTAARARLKYNNYPLVIQEAISGRGVALAWRGLVEPMLDSGTLMVVGPDVEHTENAYQLISGSRSPTATFERVADWLTDTCRT